MITECVYVYIQKNSFSLTRSSELKRAERQGQYLDDEISRTIMFAQPHPSTNDRNQFASIIDAYPKEGYGK